MLTLRAGAESCGPQSHRIIEVTSLTRHRTKPAVSSTRTTPFVVAACFFLSGAAGLIYEVIWVRLIDKVIGSAPFAVATVLSVFMGGLALGSYLAGRVIDRRPSRDSLLALYGGLEIGLGLYALALPFIIDCAKPIYRLLYNLLLDHFWWYQGAALAGCLLLLIFPAGLMGATLPVLCRFYVRRFDHVGTRTGRLYGLNTAGAALGVVLCGFVLIKQAGVWSSLCLTAGVNISAGTVCLLLARFAFSKTKPKKKPLKKTDPAKDPGHLDATAREPDPLQLRQARWATVLFAASGFCAMAYEVLWTRLLGLIAGPTTYCFTLVVATFIAGLALGSTLFSRTADTVRRVFVLLAATQVFAAAAALVVSHLLGNSQFFFAKLIYTCRDHFTHLLAVQSLVIFLLLLMPTLFLGAAFPLVNRLCVRAVSGLGRSLGKVYALNTIGAIAGSITAGYILTPWLGKENSLRLVIGLQAGLACLAVLHAGSQTDRKYHARIPAAVLLLAASLLLARYPSWRSDLLSRGWYRDFKPIEQALDRSGWIEAFLRGPDLIADQRKGLSVVFQGEGIGGFTTVEKETTSLGTVEYALFNSGKADASSHGDRSTQALSAHIPLLVHPNARHVMVLGLASGMTPGEVLLYPVEKLDIVEINEQVVAACRNFFSPWNNRCLDDPRTRLIVQDGRNHLALTKDTYDVIISEPSNPWMAGLANLYSREFFQLARQRLGPKGLFAQWIQSYEMDWETFSLLGRTFASVFPDGALLKIGPVDYLMLGFVDKKGLDWSSVGENLRFAQQSGNVTFPGATFLAHLVLTEDLPALFGPGPLHTDDRPHLEFTAPMKLYSGSLNIDLAVADRRRLSPQTLTVRDTGDPVDTLLDLIDFSASANVPMFNLLPWDRLDTVRQARYRRAVLDYCGRVLVPSYGIFNDPGLKTCCAGKQIDAINNKIATQGAAPIDPYNLGLALIAAGRPEEAEKSLRSAISMAPANVPAVMALGLLLAESSRLPEAADLLADAVALAPNRSDARKFLGMVELRRGALETGAAHLAAALSLAPDDTAILSELGLARMRQGKNHEAVIYLSKAVALDPQNDQDRYFLKMAQTQIGKQTAMEQPAVSENPVR